MVCGWPNEWLRPDLEPWKFRKRFPHGGKIFRVIGRDAQFTVRFKGAAGRAQEARVHHATIMMTLLRPRIGKEQVEDIDRAGREEVLRRMQNVGLHNFCIR